jgi:hypothetical protein
MSLNLELDKLLKTDANCDLGQFTAAPLRLENGNITSTQQPIGDQSRSSVSGTSADSDPVSASSEPDRLARRSQGQQDVVDVRWQTGSRSPRALDEWNAKYPAAPGRASLSSRSARLPGVEPRDSGSMVPLLSPRSWTARSSEGVRHFGPRQRHHHDRKRNSPRGGKLPSLQFKVASPRNRVRQQQHSHLDYFPGQAFPAKLSPRCNTAEAAAIFGFVRPGDLASRSSPLRGASGQRTSSMLAREAGRIQSSRGAVELEIET